ncbi:hypothetical protein [Photobacterium ganghwense]|uniref:hypothetical protein n=1 Tax=Photobacterium ganghwense TaxID=320778 RepID=UPI0039EF7396
MIKRPIASEAFRLGSVGHLNLRAPNVKDIQRNGQNGQVITAGNESEQRKAGKGEQVLTIAVRPAQTEMATI